MGIREQGIGDACRILLYGSEEIVCGAKKAGDW
jgi:hypothetical protein